MIFQRRQKALLWSIGLTMHVQLPSGTRPLVFDLNISAQYLTYKTSNCVCEHDIYGSQELNMQAVSSEPLLPFSHIFANKKFLRS